MYIGASVNSLALSAVVKITPAAPSVIPEQSKSLSGGATIGEVKTFSIGMSFWNWANGFVVEKWWFFAETIAKNHHFSTTNPFAQFQKYIPAEKVLSSPMVAPPLRLFDCSGITDGAAGVVLTSAERAKEFTDTPMYILGSGQCSMGSNLANYKSFSTWYPLKEAAKEAYRSARVAPKDLDLAEVHDCFTISEIMEYEDLGFCDKGKGGQFIKDGQSDLGGRIPINTRGGLLGTCHPLGATGIAQAIELMQQFRSSVPRQRLVDNAETGLAHNLSGAANVHSILVYGRNPP